MRSEQLVDVSDDLASPAGAFGWSTGERYPHGMFEDGSIMLKLDSDIDVSE
jgi:hypothetical protein